ncbi:MAG: gamma-glutamylcyclotransferase family protein [Bacteroidota bacterium]
MHNLFVYGSLRSGFKSPMYDYIRRYFTFVGNAKVKGKLLDMGDYPVAIPTNEEHYIHGELFSINHSDEFNFAIAQLDDYEGLNPEDGEYSAYRRDVVSVDINNSTVTAWVYWFNGDTTGRPLVESGDVLMYMLEKSQS